jgi:hypothetical protein
MYGPRTIRRRVPREVHPQLASRGNQTGRDTTPRRFHSGPVFPTARRRSGTCRPPSSGSARSPRCWLSRDPIPLPKDICKCFHRRRPQLPIPIPPVTEPRNTIGSSANDKRPPRHTRKRILPGGYPTVLQCPRVARRVYRQGMSSVDTSSIESTVV